MKMAWHDVTRTLKTPLTKINPDDFDQFVFRKMPYWCKTRCCEFDVTGFTHAVQGLRELRPVKRGRMLPPPLRSQLLLELKRRNLKSGWER